MGDFEELLSAEPLCLLEDYMKAPGRSSLPQEPNLDKAVSNIEPCSSLQLRRKRRRAPSIPAGCLTFALGDSASPKPKRAQYGIERRDQVANVCRVGSCNRCKHLKISVSAIQMSTPVFVLV